MDPLWATLIAIAAIGFVFVCLPVATDAYVRYRDPRVVACPHSGFLAAVQLDAWHAAATAVPGPPGMHIIGCSRWPERADCDRACVDGALRR